MQLPLIGQTLLADCINKLQGAYTVCLQCVANRWQLHAAALAELLLTVPLQSPAALHCAAHCISCPVLCSAVM